jgi:hypothetical protein
MKRRWREILSQWKEDCIRDGINYATIPKRVCKPHPQVVRYCTVSVPYQYRYQYGVVLVPVLVLNFVI